MDHRSMSLVPPSKKAKKYILNLTTDRTHGVCDIMALAARDDFNAVPCLTVTERSNVSQLVVNVEKTIAHFMAQTESDSVQRGNYHLIVIFHGSDDNMSMFSSETTPLYYFGQILQKETFVELMTQHISETIGIYFGSCYAANYTQAIAKQDPNHPRSSKAVVSGTGFTPVDASEIIRDLKTQFVVPCVDKRPFEMPFSEKE